MKTFQWGPLFLFLLLINLPTYQPINSLYAQEIDVKTKIKELKHKDPKVRLEAIETIRRSKDKTGIRELEKIVKLEKEPLLRKKIVTILGESKDNSFFPAIKEVVNKETIPWVKMSALEGLANLQNPASIPLLENIISNPQEKIGVRLFAVNTLGLFPQKEATVALLSVVELLEEEIVAQAVHCLARRVSQEELIVPALIKASKDKREKVKKAAQQSLQILGKE